MKTVFKLMGGAVVCLALMFMFWQLIVGTCPSMAGIVGDNGTPGTVNAVVDGTIRGYLVKDAGDDTPTANGTWDSITVFIRNPTANACSLRAAIYQSDSNTATPGPWVTLVDSIAPYSTGTTNDTLWVSRPVVNGAAAVAGKKYWVMAWAKAVVGSINMAQTSSSTGDTTISKARVWNTNAWPVVGASSGDFAVVSYNVDQKYAIYATYTVTGGGDLPPRRRHMFTKPGPMGLVQDAIQCFAGGVDEVPR